MKDLRTGLDARQLKLLAVILMVIDHLGAAILEPLLIFDIGWDASPLWMMLDFILRMTGRLSFPMFCFLLVEGFLHTHDVKRYILQMVAFSLISEVPFDLAFFQTLWEPQYQNVFFTLTIALCVLYGLRSFQKKWLLQIVCVLAGCIMAGILSSDYSYIGILLVVSFYAFHDHGMWRNISAGAILLYETYLYFGFGILALLPLQFYNGNRGSSRGKYVFYWFYPLHLLLFYGVRMLLSGMLT